MTSGTIEKILARENFLFVGSSEGAVTIYGKKDHAFYHTVKPHSKGMLDMDIHGTGRLLLTLGADFKMKLTDLASISEVYHKNINPGRSLLTQPLNSSGSLLTKKICSWSSETRSSSSALKTTQKRNSRSSLPELHRSKQTVQTIS